MKHERAQKWQDSLTNFKSALSNLVNSVSTPIREKRDLSGIIKDFEICYELSWKTLRTLLLIKGHEVHAARDVFKTAYQLKLVDDEQVWIAMIEDRNRTLHTYNESRAQAMVTAIKDRYVAVFQKLDRLFASQKAQDV